MSTIPVTSGLVAQFEAGNMFLDAAKTQPATTDGQAVYAWTDQSGTGTDLTQSSVGNRPIYRVNQFGTLPGIQVDGTTQFLTAVGNASPNFTIFCVAYTTPGNQGSLYGNQSPDNTGILYQPYSRGVIFGNVGAVSGNLATSSFIEISAVTGSNAAPCTLTINGNAVPLSGSLTANHGYSQAPTLLLGRDTGANGSASVIGGYWAFNRVLSPAEITQVTAYINGKYSGYNQTPAASMVTQTFPMSSIARWGSWSVPEDSPAASGMNSIECQVAFNFFGSGVSLNMQLATGQNTNPALGFYYILDGVRRTVGLGTQNTNVVYNQFIASGLYDGPHTLIVGPNTPYYQTPYQWALDLATAAQVTGASPSVSAALHVSATPNFVSFVGDSRTQGFGNSGTQGGTVTGNSYPYFALQSLGAGWSGVNEGSYSELASAELARYSSDVATQFNSANSRNVLVFWGGINDSNSQSAAQMQQTTMQYVAKAEATGFHEIIVPTLPMAPSGGPYTPAVVNAYNAWLKANYLSIGATSCPDLAAPGVLLQSDYISDSLHFADSGNQKIAAAVVNGIGNQIFSNPLTALVLTAQESASGVALTCVPTGGTGTVTYQFSRSAINSSSPMALGTNTTGALTDAAPNAGVVNVYTVTATDSGSPPITLAVSQAVIPIGTFHLPAGILPSRQPSRDR